jgi:hypothetical protein
MSHTGASLRDRAGRPADQAAARLGDTATIPSAFTPGPWRLDYQGGYGKSGVYCDDPLFAGKTLAGVHLPPDYEKGGHSQRAFDTLDANASLIAAAPDLYEALDPTNIRKAAVLLKGAGHRLHAGLLVIMADMQDRALTKARGDQVSA